MASGIYGWTVRRGNKVPLVYVGQAKDFADRWRRYEDTFEAGVRRNGINNRLFNAVMHYGRGAADVRVLEECVPEELTERERAWYWQAKAQEELGLCEVANVIVPGSNPMASAETRERHLASAQRHRTDEAWLAAQREGIARRSQNETWREHKRQAAQKTFPGFRSPEGHEYRGVYGLKEFCQQNGLRLTKMSEVAAGKRPHHRGWTRLAE